MEAHRLRVAEHRGGKLYELPSPVVVDGSELTVGRLADVVIAADPADDRVSRVALHITLSPEGWLVRMTNRNGVVVRPWGQPSWKASSLELLPAARVALRVLGSPNRAHWVLLEDDDRLGAEGPDSLRRTIATELEVPVRPLTKAQVEVLGCLFGGLLAWPPWLEAEPLQLKQVARRVGISVSAVQARLSEVRAKASALGLVRQVPLSDPEYLYVLVRAGYLRPADLA
jgi:hypothetical protein